MTSRKLPGLGPEDVIEIQQIVALCGHLLDSQDWDRLDEIFSEDVVFDVTDLRGPVVVGLANLRKHFAGREHPVAHHTTNVVIQGEPGARSARLQSKYLLPREDGTVASGDYFDVVVKTAVGWRISQRRCTLRRQRYLPPSSRRS